VPLAIHHTPLAVTFAFFDAGERYGPGHRHLSHAHSSWRDRQTDGHTQIHAYTHIHIHTYMRTYMLTCLQAHAVVAS
jgi:hypothetical protein